MGCDNSTAAYDRSANKKTAGAKIICPGGRFGTSRLFARPRLFEFSARLFALTCRSLLGNGRHVNRQTAPCQAFFELLWWILTQRTPFPRDQQADRLRNLNRTIRQLVLLAPGAHGDAEPQAKCLACPRDAWRCSG